MKKEVFILALLLIILSFSVNIVSASWWGRITGMVIDSPRCIDSDSGINYLEKGSIKLNNEYSSGEESDKCTGVGEGISELICGSDGCGYSVVYPTKERKSPQYMLIYDNGNCNQATASGGFTYDCSVEGKICSGGLCVENSTLKCIPNWECNEWSPCQKFRDSSMNFIFQQTRNCDDKNNCVTLGSKPDVVQSCSNPCIENWSCSEWSTCLNDKQTRACNDINKCGTNWDIPLEEKGCDKLVEDCLSTPFKDLDKDGCNAGVDSDCGGIEGVDNPKVTCFDNIDNDCDGKKDKEDTDLSCNLECGDGICGWYERINTSSYYCEDDCIEKTFCKKYYNGIEFDGFCFTDFNKTVLEYTKADNGILRYTPSGSNVERTVKYPVSVKVIDSGLDFSVLIKLENKGNSVETIRLNDFRMFVFDNENINFDKNYTIQPKESKEITIPIELLNVNARQSVNNYISFQDNQNSYTMPRIILYWDYNPFSEKSIEVLECGNRKYNKNQGVCINKILFPAIEGFSCDKDVDCLNYDNETSELKCFEHSCLAMSGNYNIGSKDKRYKVGLLPVYITDNENNYTNMKNKVDIHLNDIIPKMENWFSGEKVYWNVSNNFGFDYYKVNDNCKMNYSEWAEIHPNQGHMSEEDLKRIETKCVSNKDYDILIISIQRDDYFPNFVGAGINYQTIMASAFSSRTIIHEILHSFGEHDLYGVESYQWGNCYLYNVNTGVNWDVEMPTLCKFEAMQMGWIQKYPITNEALKQDKEVDLVNCDDGCIINNKCVPPGIRNQGYYCSLDKQVNEQKLIDGNCENNFECNSNICIDNKCISSGAWNKFLSWFKGLFGGK